MSSSNTAASVMQCGTDTDETCDDSVENMTSQEACEAVKRQSDNIYGVLQGFTPAAMIKEIGNAIGSDSESTSEVLNNLNISMSSDTISKQMSSCQSQISSIQNNKIKVGGPECIDAYARAGWEAEDIRIDVSGITQENYNESETDCQITAIMESLTKMDAGIDNAALQEAINKSQGLLSSSSSDQYACNNISTSMSACKYVSQSQCCNNSISSNQSNLFDTGCGIGSFKDIKQKNDNKAMASCLLGSMSTVTDDLKSDIKNTVTQKADNSSTGLTLDMLALAILLPLLILGYIGYKMSKYILLIIGGVFIAVGIGFMHKYNSEKIETIVKKNIKITNCDGTKLVEGTEPAQIKFSEIKSYLDSNKDKIIGYEFLPLDPANLDDILNNKSDNSLGVVSYLSMIDRNKIDDSCSEKTESQKSIVYFPGNEENKTNFYLGIGFIAGGSLLILISLGLIAFLRRKANVKPSKSAVVPGKK